MKIITKNMKLKGNKTLIENKLAHYRDKIQNKELVDAGLLREELAGYGVQTGDRVLPYLMQDIYKRDIEDIELKTIVLENETLKATFLPEYGMRLYSLYDKSRSKDLLYVNPILRFANLAIRRAWFSGGIEWNIGQLGHTFSTCDPMHVIKGIDEQGNEFIRTFEYERCKGVFWSIDFHLPKGAKQLCAYVKIINNKPESVPMYWWTNAAVDEDKDVRVFSGNKNVIFINETSNQGNKKGMAHGEMPYLDSLKGKDSSYPTNYNFSCEYFFQNEKRLDETWEAAVYNNNTMYYERSSSNLCYRKMFCWGTHNGGKHWQEFLTQKGTPGYLELQAGLAPTQVHGLEMPGNSSWDFVQLFGGCDINHDTTTGNWEDAKSTVYNKLNDVLSEEAVENTLEFCRRSYNSITEELLHIGNGFGAVEAARNKETIPDGFYFSSESITEKEQPWLDLHNTGIMKDGDILQTPSSYMVDMRYEPILTKAAQNGSFTAYNHLGVMYIENGMPREAVNAFNQSNIIAENPFAYRNLYILADNEGDATAILHYDKAVELLGDCITREYVEEYIVALCNTKQYEKAMAFYHSLKNEIKNGDRVLLNMFEVSAKLKDTSFMEKLFKHEFAVVREGERSISDYYFIYQALCNSMQNNVEFTDELVAKYKRENNIPFELDFRLSVV